MTEAEGRVADVVLGDVELAVRGSNAEPALPAGVSEPTVACFWRTVGFRHARAAIPCPGRRHHPRAPRRRAGASR
jgi:DNA-binding MurR/RpiR family transcriptional regulator